MEREYKTPVIDRDDHLDDTSGRGRDAHEIGGGDVRDHPAGSSHAAGVDHKPDDPDETLMPDYARGARTNEPDDKLTPNYARGVVGAEPDEDDMAEGRYSRGAESPATEAESDQGSFATGTEKSAGPRAR